MFLTSILQLKLFNPTNKENQKTKNTAVTKDGKCDLYEEPLLTLHCTTDKCDFDKNSTRDKYGT